MSTLKISLKVFPKGAVSIAAILDKELIYIKKYYSDKCPHRKRRNTWIYSRSLCQRKVKKLIDNANPPAKPVRLYVSQSAIQVSDVFDAPKPQSWMSCKCMQILRTRRGRRCFSLFSFKRNLNHFHSWNEKNPDTLLT